MKNTVLFSIILCLSITYVCGQKVRWPYELNGGQYGAGVPPVLGKGDLDLYPGDFYVWRDDDGNPFFHYRFLPCDARQIMIMELDHPGAITRIVLGHEQEGKKDVALKEIYTAEPEVMDTDFHIRNINFPRVKNVTDIWMYADFDNMEGTNRIGGVALADFEEPYIPGINLPESEPFDSLLEDMNDDVMGTMLFGDLLSPLAPIISVDNKYIHFTSAMIDYNKALVDPNTTVEEGVDKIFTATLGDDGKIKLVELSNYNLDDKVSTHSGLSAISQDNNTFYINTFDSDLTIYRVSMTKDKKGYARYHKERIKFGKYEDQSEYMNEIMSYDENFLIITMWTEDDLYGKFERDLYVARKIRKSQYGEFIRMGDDINTIGAEIPCFLAPDNRTLFFATDGHIGYGRKDIYVSRRLDDTWQNWSLPVNLGPRINSEGTENYFMVDSRGEYAYVVKWDTDKEGFADLFRVKINQPGPEEKVEQTVKPEPVVIIQGKVLNKKDNSPVKANIMYHDINSMELMGEAESNAVSGEYSIALPKGILYSYEASAEDFLSASNNIDTRGLEETESITHDLKLVPIEVGEIIRLNNIFFETDKAELKEESNLELEKLLNILTVHSKMEIEISGHTDNVGSDDYNLNLSQQRTETVVSWLTERGIDANRLVAKGYGEASPVASNETEKGRQLNRRVEFKILKR